MKYELCGVFRNIFELSTALRSVKFVLFFPEYILIVQYPAIDSNSYRTMEKDDSPMKLQCMAAKSICVRLVCEWAEGEIPVINGWRRPNGYGTDRCSTHDWLLWQLCEMEVPRFANISSKIQYQIEDNLIPILETVSLWIQAHHRNFCHEQSSPSLSEYIVKLVWNHRFKIDNLATARNILSNDNLSPLEKFRFACVYCLVDEIEKFRDTIDSMPEFDFTTDPLVAYWSKYLRNKLRTIAIPKNSSIEMLLFKAAQEHGSWPTVVYFFDKLDSAKKSSNFESILDWYGVYYPSDFAAKMADKEWNRACSFASSKIIARIVRYGTSDQVRFVWKQCKSNMDSKNFCGILETLVPLSMMKWSDFEKWTSVLVEIWSNAGASASGKFNQSAVDMKLWQSIGATIIGQVQAERLPDFRARRRQISDPMKFIRLVLKSTPVNKRMEFFEKNFYWLIIWAPFVAVDTLMRDFLESYNRDVVKLKKEIARSSKTERSLLMLLGFGEFNELDAVVSFYFPGVGGIADDSVAMQNNLKRHKLQLITSSQAFDHMCSHAYCGDWKELYGYVEKNVSQVSVKEIMKKLILTSKYWARKIDRCEMNDLKEFMTTVYSDTELRLKHAANSQLQSLKKQFESRVLKVLFEFRDTINRRKKITFDRADLQDFLWWIYDGDEKLIDKNFKQPRLFPKGFLVQLKGCVAEGSFQVTESMNEFLEWCFATEEEKRQFKRKMIYDYREHRLIEGLLTRRKYRRSILLWFFDEDSSLIEKFTADCASNMRMYSYFISDNSSDNSSDDSDDEFSIFLSPC